MNVNLIDSRYDVNKTQSKAFSQRFRTRFRLYKYNLLSK